MYGGSMLTIHCPPRIGLSLCTALMFAGVFGGSYVTSWNWFIVLYGIVWGGIGVAMAYTAPLIVAWSHFPEKKGRVSGFITCGFGFSSAIFNLVSTALINPDNLKPDIRVEDGNVVNYYYSEEIANRVPNMLRNLSYMFLAIGVIATILLPRMKVAEKKVDKLYPQTLKECLSDKTFYLLTLISFLASTYGVYVVSSFKIFGAEQIGDDEFLTIVGSVGSFVNGVGRLFWG
jgi:MFS family permease